MMVIKQHACFSEGVVDVILKPDTNGNMLHRGFIFVDYCDHKHASTALKRITTTPVKMFNKNLYAEWAEPQAEVSDEVMATVRINRYVCVIMDVNMRIKLLILND